MNKRKRMRRVFIELAAVILFAIGVLVWMQSRNQQVTVYTWARSITDEGRNYTVKETDIVETSYMAGDIQIGWVRNKEAIIGKYITQDVTQGSPVMEAQLSTDATSVTSSAYAAQSNFRKITIPIDYSTSFAGDIQSGDEVDLVFIDTDKNQTTQKTAMMNNEEGTVDSDTDKDGNEVTKLRYATAKIFMEKLTVYQVYAADGSVYINRQAASRTTLGQYNGELSAGNVGVVSTGEGENRNYLAPKYAVLTVTPEQFEEITARMNMGRVELVGRFPGSENTDTNGSYVSKNDNTVIYAGNGTFEENINISEMFTSNADSESETKKEAKADGVYPYLQNLAKQKMTADQQNKYATLYYSYTDLMNTIYGSGWENNSPDQISVYDMKAAARQDDTDTLTKLELFKGDLESLAKELNGDSVVLPF